MSVETTTRYASTINGINSDATAVVRIAIYARLSKNRNGLSTNTSIQVAECLEDAQYYGRERGLRPEIVVIFEENDISASTYSKKPRPDYQSLIELVKQNKVDVIFATEMERLTRRPSDAVILIDLAETTDLTEIYLTSDDSYNLSTANGIYRARQAVNAAERESRKISERTRRKQADRARNGFSHGGRRCFGYKSGNMELDEAEAAILREMAQRIVSGHSFKDTAYWANEQGYQTTEGKPWYPITIRNTLRRVRYAGIREHRGAQYPAQWPAVFDAEAWERLQLTIKLGADKFADRPVARKYQLTGLVYCGNCGQPMNGETKRDHPNRPLRPTYHCRSQGNTQKEAGCGGVTVNAVALDWYIREYVFAALDSPEVANMLKEDQPNDDKLRHLLEERHAQQLRIDGLVDDYASGLLSRAELSRAKTKAQAELGRINDEIQVQSAKRRGSAVLPVGEQLRQAWDEAGNGWRGSLIEMVIERIDIDQSSRKPFVMVDDVLMRFDEDRVRITKRQLSTTDIAAQLSVLLRVTRPNRSLALAA